VEERGGLQMMVHGSVPRVRGGGGREERGGRRVEGGGRREEREWRAPAATK
jgi:hypothetical protein